MLKLSIEALEKLGYKANINGGFFTKKYEQYGIIYIHIRYRYLSSDNYSFSETPSVFIRGNCYINDLEGIELLKKAYLQGMEDIAKATCED